MSSFASSGMGATFNGPAGVLISLGIENLISNPILLTQLYNYAAIIPLFILAITAGQRDTRFVALLIPLWAGFGLFAGWLKLPDTPGVSGSGVAGTFALVVILLMMGIMTYMHESVHERFGIAGPGNKVVKIFTFLIVLQCCVAFVNSAAIFPSLTPSTGGIGTITATNTQYSNINLNVEMTSLSGTGGLFAGIVDIASATLQIAVSALILFLKLLLSIALFSSVLASVFPWIMQAGSVGLGFLILVQFAIWTMYLIFIFTIFYKPGPDPGW